MNTSEAIDLNSHQLEREVFCYQMIIMKNNHDIHLKLWKTKYNKKDIETEDHAKYRCLDIYTSQHL